LLSFGGYFGYNALYSPNDIAVVPVVEMQGASVATLDNDPLPEPVSQPANQNSVERAESNPVPLDDKIAPRQNERRIVLSKPANRRLGGGSIDAASREPRVIKRLDPNRKITTVPAKDVLTSIGIEADATWKVGSVKQNSVAERSGLKAGDVIEAVNNQTLTEKTTFGNKFNSKSLRVLRDGKSVQIDLKP
ncbi:MAG: PDZ domain-containing protein, partial [Pyrinomonadaceae bacterium]